MSASYDDIPKRIREERIRLGLSQEEMSHYARIDQSDFSKVELGTRRLKYAEMKGLCESPANVYYIFTGKRVGEEYQELFTGCSYDKLITILHIILTLLISTGNKDVSVSWNDVYVSIEGLCKKWNWHKKEYNAISMIRRLKHFQQKDVADKLGIDIKKYRNLENGKKLPDSELVWELYNYHGLSPSIILKDSNCLVEETCCTLMELDDATRKMAIELIKGLNILG